MTETRPKPLPEGRHPGRRGVQAQKATLLCLATLTIMSGAAISPALPAIEAHFAASPDAALLTRLVLTAPALLVALAAPVMGALSDRFGRRPLLLGTITLYAAAGMSGLVLDSLPGLLSGRALLGVAVAGLMATGTALAGDYYTGAERDRYMGLQMACTGLGGLVFLTGGGLLADLHWRLPFAIYGLALALLPAVALFLPEPSRPLFSTPAASLEGRRSARRSRLAIAALCAIAVANGIAFYVIPTQLPYGLQARELGGASEAGLAIGGFTLASAMASLAYGRLRARLRVVTIFAIAFGVMAAGLVALGFAFGGHRDSYAAIALATGIAGLGMGLVVPNLLTGAMQVAAPAMRGRVAGTVTAGIFVGQFISPFVSQPWIAGFGLAAAFRDAGLLLAGIALLALVVDATAPRRPAS